MTQRSTFVALRGGLDLVSPALLTPPGNVIAALNYEPHPRGYRRLDGFERLDGRPAPSAASYWVLDFDAGTTAIVEGDTVTGADSAATGVALVDAVVESGSFAGNDAAGYLVLTAVSGTFADNEDLEVSAATVAVADGTATEKGAANDTDHNTWLRDAIETARAAIQTVPGSGVIRGAQHWNATSYAVRDNAGATAGVLYKSTTAGWAAIDLGRTIDFTGGGTAEVAEGDTVTGAISTATAVVERVILTSGTWAGGDAAGRLILSGQVGTFQAENLDTSTQANIATVAGNSTAHSLPAGGRYEFRIHNFYGASDLERLYGVNGVGPAFELDADDVFVPIDTGMADDKPTHLAVHKNQLTLAFPGGSHQNSAVGNPYSWSPVLGASEIGVGEDITGMVEETEGVELILGRNAVLRLNGNDSTDFVLEPISRDSGGVEWTVVKIGRPLYVDDYGIRSIETTRAFGDFQIGLVSEPVEPLFRAKRDNDVSAVGATRSRGKGQYILFWSDGTGLRIYMAGQTEFNGRPGFRALPFDLGKTISCVSSGEDANGEEVILFGSDDGYVYRLDRGTSFDGAEIEAYLRLPFNHLGSPQVEKRFHKAILEVDARPQSTLKVAAEFSYADANQPPAAEQSFTVSGSGGFWDEATWDDFFWDGQVEGTAEAHLDGLGKTISLAISSNATYEEPHVLHGLTLNWSPRRLAR